MCRGRVEETRTRNTGQGTRVFRRWIQIPEKINGYATQGSRVSIDLRFGSPDSLKITVFSNGAILYRGSDDDILPMLLTENAQPGQKFLVAARVVAGDEAQSEFFHSELTIEPPHSRPDPVLLRTELLAARPIITAYEEGKAERQQQLDAALKAIDFSPLDRGDQGWFRCVAQTGTFETRSAQALAAAVQHSNRWQFAHRHGMAVAMDRDGRSRTQYVPERARLDARISRLQVHDVVGAHLRMDAGEIS